MEMCCGERRAESLEPADGRAHRNEVKCESESKLARLDQSLKKEMSIYSLIYLVISGHYRLTTTSLSTGTFSFDIHFLCVESHAKDQQQPSKSLFNASRQVLSTRFSSTFVPYLNCLPTHLSLLPLRGRLKSGLRRLFVKTSAASSSSILL